MYNKMIVARLTCALCLLSCLPLQAAPLVLGPDVWARPRSADVVARQPGMAEMLTRFDESSADLFLIRHPGGDEGVLRAQELRAWLISLGVPSTRIELQAGVKQDESISVELLPDGMKQ